MRIAFSCGVALASACGAASTTSQDLGRADLADAGKPPAPVALRSFESAAEGIGDAARVPDWNKTEGVLHQAQATWMQLAPQLRAAGAVAATLALVDDTLARAMTDVAARRQRAAETDANTVTLAVPDFFDLYSYPVPSDVLRGDGVFRQLQIEAEYSDWAMAATE